MKMHSADITKINLEKIKSLFPGLVTESRDSDGNLTQVIDFDLLRQELSDIAVDGQKERYQINWPGKRDSLLASNIPVNKTLRPVLKKSLDFASTKNIFIEGDNLEALKLLQESYLGKIKIIYIDPPYNTGKDFIYRDAFQESIESFLQKTEQKNKDGDKLVANTESNGRFHSDWLSMIYPRLRLARNLMSTDGVIFISIDDNEVQNLRKLCDEIFGEDCFIEQFTVRSNPRGNQAKKFVASEHEYILCYCRDISKMSLLGFSKEEGEFNKEDEGGIYREIGLRKRGAGSRREDAPNQYYPIYYVESNKLITTDPTLGGVEILPKLSDGADGRWRWAKSTVEENKGKLLARTVKRNGSNEYDIFEKDYFSEDKLTKIKSIFYEKEVNNENATEELKTLFKSKTFDYPKPVYTIKKLIQSVNDDSALVMDFFAGSGTTAQAVMELNAEDSGSRKFILVQIPESISSREDLVKLGYSNLADLSSERIRLASAKIKGAETLQGCTVDTGFRYLSIDSTNMHDVYYNPDAVSQDLLSDQADNVKADRTAEDLLFQVLLDWGVDLSLPIQRESVQGKDVYLVDQNALAACFDSKGGVDEEFVKELAKKQPLRVVFRDAGFKSDSVKINVEQIFKLVSPSTEVKCI